MDKRQSRKLKPLLPSSAGESSSSQEKPHHSTPRLPKRISLVKVACDACRKKRVKCDGGRPKCGPCVRKGDECVYAALEGETTSLALKRKFSSLEQENIRYRELFAIIRSKPNNEAQEIYRRLRATDRPLLILEAIRQAEILLPRENQSDPMTCDESTKLDREALKSSAIHVPALPWTTVAGDGLVSELITGYFAWDNTFLFPSIDRNAFVEEMQRSDVESATWCSPLLVNAICAQRSQTLDRARLYGAMTHQNLTARFLNNAKHLLEHEQGHVSIPTAQALMLMYLTMTCLGRDRAGRLYRQYSLDMVRRLNLESKYASIAEDAEHKARDRRLISKALWGLFLFETRISFFYFQVSDIPPPGIPHPFTDDDIEDIQSGNANVDVLGHRFDESPYEVPIVPGILSAACLLSELFYDIMKYKTNNKAERGSERDINTQKRLYVRLRQIEEYIPGHFLVENNPTPSTGFLRLHFNEVAFAIIQTLRHETLFETPAKAPGTTIKDVCLYHCQSDIDTIESFLQVWPYEALLWRHLYLCMQPLVIMLEDPQAVQLFTRACRMMRSGSAIFRICGYLLQASQAFARAVGREIPRDALPFFEDLESEHEEEAAKGKALPVSFALPQQDDMTQLLEKGLEDGISTEEDLGALIEKWSL